MYCSASLRWNDQSKRHSFEKKIVALMFSLGSQGGYREIDQAFASHAFGNPSDSCQASSVSNGFYPALNMQEMVDASMMFRSVDVRPGSWSNQKIWNASETGKTLRHQIPPGTHIIAGAGYALRPWMLTPYAKTFDGTLGEVKAHRYSFAHSSTRMVVERTFGVWKERFRISKVAMQAKDLQRTMISLRPPLCSTAFWSAQAGKQADKMEDVVELSEGDHDDCMDDESEWTGDSDSSFSAVSNVSDDANDDEDGSAATAIDICILAIRGADKCQRKCLCEKSAELRSAIASIMRMAKRDVRLSMRTSLAIAFRIELKGKRKRESGKRTRFFYRHHKDVLEGNVDVPSHGNVANAHNSQIVWAPIQTWFSQFAATVGNLVPLRVRLQKTENGKITAYTTSKLYTIIPPTFTWEKLYVEMKKAVPPTMTKRPLDSAFRKQMMRDFPHIVIWSPRSNVSDVCAVYTNTMKKTNSADTMEVIGQHISSARQMRELYKHDVAMTSDEYVVLTMDFSQNFALPQCYDTPSEWYFLFLINVYLFTRRPTRRESSNEVVSMLDSQLFHDTDRSPSSRTLTVYADNCCGQNKNNFVVKFMLLLAHVGMFKEVRLRFLVKGHTKTARDRSFAFVRKKYMRSDRWTLEQFAKVVHAAGGKSPSEKCKCVIAETSDVFYDNKPIVNELYKNIAGITKYEMFRTEHSSPGVVECKMAPDGEACVMDLRKAYDSIRVTPERALMLWNRREPLSQPPVNPEKVKAIHEKVRKYVPHEYRSDPFYVAPTERKQEIARAAKKARSSARASLRASNQSEAENTAIV
ncbi:TPA: hypothetical protein N0F65_007313 [Lagenidium giganteum]|uniref:DDE Tnp4 domain-containing protein n=1 Tax=Lagenidium giganteum TaxID=4803 RepID=A0AAV2Z4U0_9STRA|nr:TPA: hypothetical protein N0F65_007313 [Lagenidium giganteum]